MQLSDIESVACIGAGTIGSSWATVFAQKGYRVNLYDISQESLSEGMRSVRANLEVLADCGVISRSEADSALDRISTTTSLAEAVEEADYVQESGPERYDVKGQIFAQVDKLIRPEVVMASSSSALLMTEIQKATANPGRCVIAHPWNPAYLMPLVEIVRGDQTVDATVELTRELMTRLGKVPVVTQKEMFAYIGNRLQYALMAEAISIVGDGVATAPDVDTACRTGPGLRWALLGPFMIGALASRGGLAGVFGVSQPPRENDSQKPVYAPGQIPAYAQTEEWMRRRCVEQMEPELADKDWREMAKQRDVKLIEILRALGYV